MKSTGIVRRIDNLGRVVLPIELRRALKIEVRDPIEIYVNNDEICLKKHSQSCVFCGNNEQLKEYKGKKICINCISKL